ncbi:E3 ubiquitin-protein ligase TRIM11-like [Podarcis raffonei]|uniref:E3 ubiquitin-protein ligase TRIM11-like n=1 Tax=Podarcis raffonei TaxID=65483 RepID=UPI0023295F3A|nr:E3 ubiquitin-protein ligase TRIM11-like [Podarcis raffonei]
MQRPGDMFFLKKDHVVTEFLSHFQEGKLPVAENGENETYLGLLPEGAMAAAGGHIQRLRDEATCSICLDYFKDPVTIPECGHNFCRSCLIQCWGESEAEASCPQCRERVQRRSLIPNRQLANFVEIAQNLSLQEGKEEGGKGGVCEEHQEPMKLFCKEDEALICLVCDKSKEHENHKVIPLKEAIEEYKGEICSHLEILRREREEILAYQAALDKESKDLLKLTETERLKTVEKFRELRQFLEEQEKRLLTHVEEVEKEIAGRRDEQLARLSRKLSSLERIIQEMEEKSQQPASELLQDVRRTLQRYEERESPEKPLAFPPELKNRILESCDLNHLVEDRMNLWEDAVLFRKQLQKDVQSFRHLQRANVTLDPDTAHPELILSKDRKSLSRGDKPQALPNNPQRFSHEINVLGSQGFTAGRHFWEITVESGELWGLGVARKSVRRKGSFSIFPEEGIWAVRKLGRKYFACTSPYYSLLSPSEKPRRIRVTLDYEGGCVSFSDADSGAELYTFSGASFSAETLLPFFCLRGNKTDLIIF